MLTLGIDTTADCCAVGLWKTEAGEGRVVGARRATMAKGHAEALFPMLDDLFAAAGVDRRDLDRVAVVRGPGTFTGARIGLAAARGLALALDIPAVGVTAFECLAAALRDHADRSSLRAVALDARRGEIYLQVLGADLTPVSEPVVAAPARAISVIPNGLLIAVGTGAHLLADAAREVGRDIACASSPERDGALVARLGAERDPDGHPPLPLYLRPPDAKRPLPTSLRAAGAPATG